MESSIPDQLFYELNKKITAIYFSINRFKLKNDCVCRLIAEAFPEVGCVSILLYESKRDSLINFGHYLDPERAGAKFTEASSIEYAMLKNIALYEYFVSKRENRSKKTCTLTDFKATHYFYQDYYFDPETGPIKYSKSVFDFLRDEFFEDIRPARIGTHLQRYKNYKIGMSAHDIYDLNEPTTISGKYFKKVTLNELDNSEKQFIITSSDDIGTKNKVLNNVYAKNFHIELDADYNYLSIPLHVNGRCIGLIRFLMFERNSHIIPISERDNVQATLMDFSNKKAFKYLKELSETIAFHIGNDFYTYGFKRAARTSLQDYNQFAELYADAINSRVCIIRMGDDYGKNVSIKGFTSTATDFINAIISNGEDHIINNKLILDELFQTQNSDGKEMEVIALQFEISQGAIGRVKYFYFLRNGFINTEHGYFGRQSDINKLQRIFKPLVLSKLSDMNINEVLLIKIPYVSGSYISFCNTIYRTFIINDLDIIYPQILRLGSELFIRQSNTQQQKSDLLAALYHSLEMPVQLAKGKIIKTKSFIADLLGKDLASIMMYMAAFKMNPKDSFKEITEFEHLIKFIDYHFALLKIKQGIDSGEEYPDLYKGYSFSEQLSTYIDIHSEYARDHHKLAILKDWSDFEEIIDHHHEMLFLGIFLCLMENALKYSFKESDRAKFVSGYDQDFAKKSDGHIRVNLIRDNQSYGYSITNWGKEIPAYYIENDRILKAGVRCDIDLDFESIESPVKGDGKGLYYVKQLIDKSEGELKINSQAKKTTITVLWKLPTQKKL